MSERRVYLAIILFILAAVLAVTVFYAVRYMDFFAIDRITVTGMDQVPHSVSRILVSCHGLNRFRVDVDEMEEAVEDNPLVAQCIVKFSFPAHMEVALIPSDEKCLLSDGESYYLMDDGRPVELAG